MGGRSRNGTTTLRHIALIVMLCVFSALGVVSVPSPAQDTDALLRIDAPDNAVWLDTLDVSKVGAGWGAAQAGRSIEKQPLRLGGVTYLHGIGAHATSEAHIDLKGVVTRFVAMVGVDDERTGRGSVAFEVYADDRLVAGTGVMRGGD